MRATRSRGLSGAIGIFEIGDVLVRPYRLQRCLAQQLLPANPAIEDLHNETRCEPGRGAKVGVLGGHVRRRLAAAAAFDAPADFADQFVREPGPDAADVEPAMFRVWPRQQQRAEPGAAALRRGVSDHRELVAGQLFGLAPILTAAAVVAAIGALGNDAFEVLLTGQAIGLVAILLHMRTERQWPALPLQHGVQQGLAFQQGRIGDVHAIKMQQIEQCIRQDALPLAGERGLQQVEVFLGAGARDELTVQCRRGEPQCRDRFTYFFQAACRSIPVRSATTAARCPQPP